MSGINLIKVDYTFGDCVYQVTDTEEVHMRLQSDNDFLNQYFSTSATSPELVSVVAENERTQKGRGRVSWNYYEVFEEIVSTDRTINYGSTLSSMPNSQMEIYDVEESCEISGTNLDELPTTSSQALKIQQAIREVNQTPIKIQNQIHYNTSPQIQTPTHTQNQTPSDTSPQIRTPAHTQNQIHYDTSPQIRTPTHTQNQTPSDTSPQIRTPAHTQNQVQSDTSPQIRTPAHTQNQIHYDTSTQIRTPTHTQNQIQSNTSPQIRTPAHTQNQIQSGTSPQIQTPAHTQNRKHHGTSTKDQPPKQTRKQISHGTLSDNQSPNQGEQRERPSSLYKLRKNFLSIEKEKVDHMKKIQETLTETNNLIRQRNELLSKLIRLRSSENKENQ